MVSPVREPLVILRPRWLIDGISSQPLTNHEVLLQGDLIANVRPVTEPNPVGAWVNDLPDATLLPGLIDCHVHYTIDPTVKNGIAQGSQDSPERAVLVGARNARMALLAGITTARSAGASRGLDVVLAAAIEAGDIPGPRLIPAGPAITITGGHGQHFGVQVDRLADMIAAVRAGARDGAKVVKLIASEAAMLTTGLAGVPELTQFEMTRMTLEAKRLRLAVMAHAQSSAAVEAAALAGVDSVEHAFLADEAALQTLKAAGAYLTPTLTVTDVYSQLADISADSRRRQAEISVAHRFSCTTAIDLGIPMVAGTDCGVYGIYPNMLGREIVLLHAHGLSPMAAIQAATTNAAKLLGLASEVGTVESGKRADLIAVAGDAIADLRQLSNPVLVIKNGRPVAPDLNPAWPS